MKERVSRFGFYYGKNGARVKVATHKPKFICCKLPAGAGEDVNFLTGLPIYGQEEKDDRS